MKHNGILLRQASSGGDLDAISIVARQSRRHFLPYLPDLHTPEEDAWFYKYIVFAQDQVWVAEDDGAIVGFCAFKADWLDHLYLLPSHVGKTLGSELLKRGKASCSYLQLWVFQQNVRAISFYERQGFVRVMETDGSGNEEKVPDALFEWRKRDTLELR